MVYGFFSLFKAARAKCGTLIAFIFLGLAPLLSGAGNTDYFLYGDFVYKNNIKTVLFNKTGFELSDPLIRLNSDDRLILRFDDLDADYKQYYYTIIHCDANWEVSELREYEYIEGFYEDRIRNYRSSRNTRVQYTHYWMEFPTPDLRPVKSGNYILKVFLDGNRDEVVFTRRFSVFEQNVTVEGHIQQANLIRYRDTRQQPVFTINTGGYNISNPYRDLTVVIRQNGRWDNAIGGMPPRSVIGNQLVYDYEDEILFDGNNEFRRFDTRSLRQLSERVHDIQSSRRHWDVFLSADRVRYQTRYISEDDINGRFQVITFDAADNMLEADYAWVHFHLPMPEPLEEGHLYVMGALTDWHFSDQNRMNYNYGDNAYELSLLLKQGYYNYMYAYLPPGRLAPADVSYIEGSHSITENDYTVYVFHRRPGDLYDQLIGIGHMNPTTDR